MRRMPKCRNATESSLELGIRGTPYICTELDPSLVAAGVAAEVGVVGAEFVRYTVQYGTKARTPRDLQLRYESRYPKH